MQIRETEFIKWLTDTSRIRHHHSQLMTFAEEELKNNWEVYIERFLKEMSKDE